MFYQKSQKLGQRYETHEKEGEINIPDEEKKIFRPKNSWERSLK